MQNLVFDLTLFKAKQTSQNENALIDSALLEKGWLCLILTVAEQLNNCFASLLKYGSSIDWKLMGMFQQNCVAELTFRVWREAALEQLQSVPCLLGEVLISCFWVQALACLWNCRIMLLRIISHHLFICVRKAGTTFFFGFAGWPCGRSWNLWN